MSGDTIEMNFYLKSGHIDYTHFKTRKKICIISHCYILSIRITVFSSFIFLNVNKYYTHRVYFLRQI